MMRFPDWTPHYIRWVNEDDKPKYANLRVSTIFLLAFSPSRIEDRDKVDDKGLQTNEWAIYLPVSTDKAISLELVPLRDQTTMILFQQVDDLIDPTAVKTVNLNVSGKLTVSEITQLIADHGFHFYSSMKDGSGCRWWMSQFIALLQKSGYLERQAEIDTAVQALDTVWISQNTPVPARLQTNAEFGAGRFSTKTEDPTEDEGIDVTSEQ